MLDRIIASSSGPLTGSLRVPGDKSISHRSVMFGALAEGVTEVTGFLDGADCLATAAAFRAMGVSIEQLSATELRIHGVGLHGLSAPQAALDLGNSGTSIRLLSGLLAGQAFATTLCGDKSLSKRPMGRVVEPLRSMGAVISTEEGGRAPLKISAATKLHGINYDLPMASAQVKSCLLLAGLYADSAVTVTEPAPTRDHTERMLQGFGVKLSVEPKGDGVTTVTLQPGQKLTATHIDVPADISSAAFFLVAASIVPDSDLTLEHVGMNPTRTGVVDILRLMGADITVLNEREVGGEPVADLRVKAAPLKGIRIPEALVPLAIDEFPVLFIAAAAARGETVLSGAEELRVKESDRIQVMADGLAAVGVETLVKDDGIVIPGRPSKGAVFGGGEIHAHGDHRIAMAFSVAACLSNDEIVIHDCVNVSTSFPNFVELAKASGFALHAINR